MLPETRSGVIDADTIQEHWALREEERDKVISTANVCGVRIKGAEALQEVFGVDNLTHFPGTVEDARRAVRDWALKREKALLDKLRFAEGTHHEARTIAWTNVITPGGVQINVTAREGASADSIVATVLALTGALRDLGELGFVSAKVR